MKKLLALIMVFNIGQLLIAQLSKTITLSSVGTLTTVLTEKEKNTISNFTISGPINALDVGCMTYEIPLLENLDLSDANFVYYHGYNGPDLREPSYYDNEMPSYSFSSDADNKDNSTLKTIVFPNSMIGIGDNALEGCHGLTSITLGDNVSYIRPWAFSFCESLTELNLPNSLNYISEYAFNHCKGLRRIAINSNIPPIVFPTTFSTSGMNIIQNNCQLIVPVGAKQNYENADNWKDFLDITEAPFTSAPSIASSEINIYITSLGISVTGTKPGQMISIYQIDGQLIAIRTAERTYETFTIQKRVIYLIKIANLIFKVAN